MNAQDLGWLDRRQMGCFGPGNTAAISGYQIAAVHGDRRDGTIQQNPAVFGHRLSLSPRGQKERRGYAIRRGRRSVS